MEKLIAQNQQDSNDPDSAGWRFPYGSSQRFHMHHSHLFASDVDATVAFYSKWFEATVAWDGSIAGARNIFLKIGIGAIHIYDQAPRAFGKNTIHHIGMQVVGIDELYSRMQEAGLAPGERRFTGKSAGYFMVMGPDNVLIEVFEPGRDGDPAAQRYFGFDVE